MSNVVRIDGNTIRMKVRNNLAMSETGSGNMYATLARSSLWSLANSNIGVSPTTAIAYNDNIWVIDAAGAKVWYSSDGITWANAVMSGGSSSASYITLGTYVYYYDVVDNISRAADGRTFTTVGTHPGAAIFFVHGSTVYAIQAGGTNGYMFYSASTNGVDFGSFVVSNLPAATYDYISYDGYIWAVSPTVTYRSIDCTTWSLVSTGFYKNGTLTTESWSGSSLAVYNSRLYRVAGSASEFPLAITGKTTNGTWRADESIYDAFYDKTGVDAVAISTGLYFVNGLVNPFECWKYNG